MDGRRFRLGRGEPERGLPGRPETDRVGEFHHRLDAEGRQRFEVELLARRQVAGADADVVEHGITPQADTKVPKRPSILLHWQGQSTMNRRAPAAVRERCGSAPSATW